MAAPPFGRLVRRHRHRLEISQEQLAERAGISTRHLSFVENGKASPSREMAVEIGNALEVPPQELGVFLEAAGYVAPTESAAPVLQSELSELLQVLSDPAFMHDRYGSILGVNSKAAALFSLFTSAEDRSDLGHGRDLFELLKPRMRNWGELQGFFRRRVFLELLRSGTSDPDLERVLHRWSGEGESLRHMPGAIARVVMDWEDDVAEFRLLTATLGTPAEVSLRDFRFALILPGNALARELLDRVESVVG